MRSRSCSSLPDARHAGIGGSLGRASHLTEPALEGTAPPNPTDVVGQRRRHTNSRTPIRCRLQTCPRRRRARESAAIPLTKHFTSWLNERRDRHRPAQPRVRGAGRPHPACDPGRAHRRRRHRDRAHGAAADLDAGGVAAPQGARGRRADLPLAEGKWQRSHLEAAPLREAAVWIERFRGFWDSSFDRLDAHLATLQQEQENR